MNKKEFYVAPEWGMRVVTVERNYLNDVSNTGIQSFDEDDTVDDSGRWGQN